MNPFFSERVSAGKVHTFKPSRALCEQRSHDIVKVEKTACFCSCASRVGTRMHCRPMIGTGTLEQNHTRAQ